MNAPRLAAGRRGAGLRLGLTFARSRAPQQLVACGTASTSPYPKNQKSTDSVLSTDTRRKFTFETVLNAPSRLAQ